MNIADLSPRIDLLTGKTVVASRLRRDTVQRVFPSSMKPCRLSSLAEETAQVEDPKNPQTVILSVLQMKVCVCYLY